MSTSNVEIMSVPNDAKIPLATTAVFLLLFLQLISDVRPITALLTVAIVCTQTFIGLTISGYKFDSEKGMSARALFFGFFYGMVIHVILDQVFRLTGFRVLVLPLLTALAVALNYKELVIVAQHWKMGNFVRSSVGRADVMFVSLLLVLIPLCQIWSWSRYSVIALLVTYLLKSTGFRWLNTKFLIIPALVGVVTASRMRQSFWWLPGWGIDEVAIFSRAVYNWGPKGDVLLAGVPVKYQWSGFSWMGLMSHLTMARDFEFVSRTAYVICVVAAVLAVYAISYELTQDQRKSIIASFVVMTFSTTISYPVSYAFLSINYQPFAIVSLLCWILVLLKWMKNTSKWCSIELALVGVFCISTKSVHLLLIIVIPLTIAMIALVKKDGRMFFGAGLTSGLSLLYTRTFFPSPTGTGLKSTFAEFTRQFGVAPEVSSMKSRLLMAVIVIGALSTVSLLIVSMNTELKPLRLLRIPLLIYFAVAVLMAVGLQRVSSTELHFLQVFVLVSLVFFASSASEIIEGFITHRILRFASAAGLCIAVLLVYFGDKPIVNDEHFVVTLMKANFAIAIFLVFSRCFLFACNVRSWGSKFQLQRLMAGSLILVSTANFVFIASTRDVRPIHKVGATYQLGQPPLREVANWINRNTGVNSIIASNLFFGEGSADNCDVPESYLLDSIANQAANTNYYTPAALIHRRFLAAGVLYASISYPGSVLPRVRTSLRPACFPDNLSRSDLKKFGVDFYIAYRPNIKKFNFWSELGKVEFRNDQYVVIRVN